MATSTIVLGAVPKNLKVPLIAGADFVAALRRKDDVPWPGTTVIRLEFVMPDTSNNVTWDAAIDGAVATWNFDKADVDAVLAAVSVAVKLWYIDGDVELLWAQGEVDPR